MVCTQINYNKVCVFSITLNHPFGTSDSPTALYPLSWSAAKNISLPRERGFPSLAHAPVPERGRQLPGLPDLASCVSSSIQHSCVSSYPDKFSTDRRKNWLHAQYESITQHCIFVKARLCLFNGDYANISLWSLYCCQDDRIKWWAAWNDFPWQIAGSWSTR